MIQTHEVDGLKLYSLTGVCLEGTQLATKTRYNDTTKNYDTSQYYTAEITTPKGGAFVLDHAFGTGFSAGDEVTIVYEDGSTPLAVWKKGQKGYSIHAMLKAHEPDTRRSVGITAGAITLFVIGLIPALILIQLPMPIIMPVLNFLGLSEKMITVIIGILICTLSAYGTAFFGKKILAKEASYSESRSKAVHQVWATLSSQ